MRSSEFIPKTPMSLDKKAFKMSPLGGKVDQKPLTANEIAAQNKQKSLRKDK